ncbi:MAG: RNA polymerase sigma factor, partial [Gemmataceae bacterium]
MTPRLLQSVLRSLADAASPASDGDLLRDFAATRAEAAFAELVRRHGRLVWAVCRHLAGSEAEAEDAFQATFLVLLKNAGSVRDGAKLSSWLHGVAYRVCSKARQGAKRRSAREQAAAAGERAGPAVPESAWDRAMAAVHEEVAKLPEALRVPFV